MRNLTIKNNKHNLLLLILILSGVTCRFLLLSKNIIPFNAESYFTAINARHIYVGIKPDWFCNACTVASSITSYLLSLFFYFLGDGLFAVKVYAFCVSSSIFICMIWVIKRLSGLNLSVLTACVLIFMPYEMSVLSMGASGYEIVILYLILFIALSRWCFLPAGLNHNIKVCVAGLFSGLGLTLHFAIVPAILSFLAFDFIYSAYKLKRTFIMYIENLLKFAFFFFVGGILYWLNYFKMNESIGYYCNGQEKQAELFFPVLRRVFSFANSILFDSGKLNYINVMLLLFYVPLFLFLAYWLFSLVKKRKSINFSLNYYVAVLFFISVSFYLLDIDINSGYLCPLFIIYPLTVAFALDKLPYKFRAFKAVVLFLFMLANCVSALSTPESRNYGELINFLNEKNLDRGFAGSDLSYGLSFASKERIITAPFWDNNAYSEYIKYVIGGIDKFYLFDKRITSELTMANRFIDELKTSKIDYRCATVGGYLIYYSLNINKKGAVYPVKYFTPIYYDKLILANDFNKNETKSLFLPIDIPEGGHEFTALVESPELPGYFPEAGIATLVLVDSITGAVIGKSSLNNLDFKNKAVCAMSFHSYSLFKNKVLINFLFDDYQTVYRYFMII